MEMVAASKMRRAKLRMESSRPYFINISNILKNLLNASLEYRSIFFYERENESTIGYLVVSSDRGLCGGLNSNLFRLLVKDISKFDKDSKKIVLYTIGKKALSFFSKINCSIIDSIVNVGDKPKVSDFYSVINNMVNLYSNKKIDRLYIAYNNFINTMNQKPTILQLLPFCKDSMTLSENKSDKKWDYIYEPDSKQLVDFVVNRYFESVVYQCVVENNASEQSSRMVAMKNATENAGEMIDRFKLIYNKERQAIITKEISEIVGGAEAI